MAVGRGQREKLARDLVEGDKLVRDEKIGVVLAIVPSVQIVKKPVLILTVQMPNGRDVHVTYSENSTVTVEV